jgi:transposase-like protein
MTMKNGRRKFTGEEKMAILRRHLVEKVPVSDVCDHAGIPSGWPWSCYSKCTIRYLERE